MSDTIVVLAKAKARKDEEQDLYDFGYALALRGKTLLTTNASGAGEHIRRGYTEAGGTVQNLKPGDTEPFDGRFPVVAFTDKRMQDQLDERMPDWRTRNWTVIHNPKETSTAGRYTREILRSLGTPLPDGG